MNEIQPINILTITISIISLVISLIVLYLTYFNKRKPIVLCPDLIQIRKESIKGTDRPNLVFYIPLVFVNKGSGATIIQQMVLELVLENINIHFNCFAQYIKSFIPKKMQRLTTEEHNLFAPFQINKYSSITRMFGFGSERFYDNLKSGIYLLKLSLKYNINKTIDYYWRFKFIDDNAKLLENRGYAVALNVLGIENQIISIKKKDIKKRIEKNGIE